MKKQHNLSRYILAFFALMMLALFVRCQDEMIVDPGDNEPTTDRAALEKIVDEDSSLTSFDYNYDEEGVMGFLGKVNTAIYPFKVGQKMRLVNRTLSIDFQDTIAYGTLTKTFEGLLLIAASYDSNATEPDTVIKKSFTSIVTRNLIFKKIGNTPYPRKNWILAAISLPEGGTQSPNFDITKTTIFLPNGDTLSIDSPNNYYLRRGWGWWHKIGKSRLTLETRSRIDPIELCVCEGHSLTYRRSITYCLFRSAIENYLSLTHPSTNSDLKTSLNEVTQKLLGSKAAQIVPYLEGLLKLEQTADSNNQYSTFLGPEQRRQQIFLAVRDFLEAAANQKPLLLILEALHWADDASLDLMAFLATTIARSPLIV